MTQVELEREICRSTGESLSRIRRLGFSLETPADDSADPEPIAAPNVIDWDEHYPGLFMAGVGGHVVVQRWLSFCRHLRLEMNRPLSPKAVWPLGGAVRQR
jgi:hypothetical protein